MGQVCLPWERTDKAGYVNSAGAGLDAWNNVSGLWAVEGVVSYCLATDPGLLDLLEWMLEMWTLAQLLYKG